MNYKALNLTKAYSPKNIRSNYTSFQDFDKLIPNQKRPTKTQTNYSSLQPQKNPSQTLLNRIKMARIGSISTAAEQTLLNDGFDKHNITFGEENWKSDFQNNQKHHTTQLNKEKHAFLHNVKKLNIKTEILSDNRQVQQNQLQNLTLKSKLKASQEQRQNLQQQLVRNKKIMKQYLQIIYDLQSKIQEQAKQYKFNLNNFEHYMDIYEDQAVFSLKEQIKTIKSFKKNPRKVQIISKTIDEMVKPFKEAQKSCRYQSKSLQLAKIQLQKKFIMNINNITKKKDDEIEDLKKDFSRKLNYYKDMLIKVTSKGLCQIKGQVQDIWQTRILQTSSEEDEL